MNKNLRSKTLLLLFSCAFFFGCISNKKHKEAINLLTSKQEATLQQEIDLRESKLNIANDNITSLNLQLAEAKGENNILLMLRKELEGTIAKMEADMESMNTRSSSTQQNLSSTLKGKETEISRLNGLLAEVNKTLDRHVILMDQLGNDLSYSLQQAVFEKYVIEKGPNQVNLIVFEDLIFKPKSVVKITDLGFTVLDRISQVIQKYPNMNVSVVGHTDNTPPKRKSNVDNWNVSAQQAATVVRLLTEEYDLNPSQILLGAKGEYAPRASNGSEEGQKENRRIEFNIAPRSEELVNAIKKVLN